MTQKPCEVRESNSRSAREREPDETIDALLEGWASSGAGVGSGTGFEIDRMDPKAMVGRKHTHGDNC